MDPLRSDTHPADRPGDADRDARIERLLLAGLDEYFAHRYEHAISIWTRVLFLDRQHDRARAYIERARRALAERFRESEVLLQEGIDAFRAGDVDRARALVAEALDRGAPHDEAQGVLDRIDRIGTARAAPLRRGRSRIRTEAPLETGEAPARSRARSNLAAGALLAAAGVGALAIGLFGIAVPELGWGMAPAHSPVPVSRAPAWEPGPLPVPRASEVYLERARSLAASGRLDDALRALDRIPTGDPLRDDGERLRAEIQRQLIALAAAERTPE